MNQDPARLKIVGATDLERRLLDAAAAEQPSPELTRRMGLALGFTAASAATVVSATAKAATATTKTIWAWAAAGTFAAALTAGVVGVWMSSRSPAPTASVSMSQQAAPAAPLLPSPSPPATSRPAAPHAPARHHATVVTNGVDLRGEIALIDAARGAIKTGAPVRALALLRRYNATYSAGTFRPEAAALRIEALVENGETEQARALARDFVAKHPDSPLSERVARLAGDPPG